MTQQTSPWGLGAIARDLLNDPNDPRVGSGRDNATGGTVSHLTASGSNSSSLASLGITFAPILIYSAICLIIFFTLRPRCTRVYGPRTLAGIRLSEDVSPSLPAGWFNWIKPFWRIPDDEVLKHSSLDGFFFLRYIKLLGTISLAGCLCTWPILLPIHGTGSNGLSQLDLLTIGNVTNAKSFLAHAVVAYVFFGFVLFTICRESIYWINLRQAYLLSPLHSKRLSSRTVLFTCVPETYLEPDRIRRLLGPSVKNTWIPRRTKELERLVKEREQTAIRLEKAEIELIKLANAARNKAISNHMRALRSPRAGIFGLSSHDRSGATSRKRDSRSLLNGKEGHEITASTIGGSGSTPTPPVEMRHLHAVDDLEVDLYAHPYGLDRSLPDVRGSVAAQWIPQESRPTHRPLANFGRRVDTIRWTRSRVKSLNTQIARLRRQHRRGDGTPLNSVFVEFDSQVNAQIAYQTLTHHLPLQMAPRFIGVRPTDVVWSSLRLSWWERIIRRFLMMAFIAVAIIFWSIPAALVGAASNLEFLAENVAFLAWVNDLPSGVRGLLQGLLPALALSALMAAVPWMLRGCARAAGAPTATQVELFTQNAYFIFQVVQVFLITTLTSAASASLTKIIENPLSAKDLLSQNLPKASNFYLSYILVQCLGRSAWSLAQIPGLIRHHWMGKSLQNPRTRFKTWQRLRKLHWGGIFPVFTNMGVIAMSYACIAPLILVFSSIGMGCIYIAYRYNLIYSYSSEPDSEGLLYPRALTQLIVGLYMAQVCLIGLFALQIALPPLILMVLFLIFTIIVHISLDDAVRPLLYSLPRTLTVEGNGASEGDELMSKMDENPVYYDSDLEDAVGDDGPAENMETYATRGLEGSSSLAASIGELIMSVFTSQVKQEAKASGLTTVWDRIRFWSTPDASQPPNFFMRWLHPEIFDSFGALQHMISSPGAEFCHEPEYPLKYLRDAYLTPEMSTPIPKLWIPGDEARVSRQEVAHTRDTIPIYDHGAWLDEKGRVGLDLDSAPFDKPRVGYPEVLTDVGFIRRL